jgi:hypothetical protein
MGAATPAVEAIARNGVKLKGLQEAEPHLLPGQSECLARRSRCGSESLAEYKNGAAVASDRRWKTGV